MSTGMIAASSALAARHVRRQSAGAVTRPCGGIFTLNPAVEANRQAEIHLESTHSAVSAQAETHGKHKR
jgi:hypothetical protein